MSKEIVNSMNDHNEEMKEEQPRRRQRSAFRISSSKTRKL